MNTDERFYFYFLCDPRKPGKHIYGQYSLPFEPYYCGKGVKSRVYSKKSKKTQDKTNKILSSGMTPYYINIGPFDEQTAFNHEEMFISLIGRDDLGTGPLYNLQEGGISGKSPSLESRQKMSLSHLNRNYEDLFGKELADIKKMKLSERWKTDNPIKHGNIPWNKGKGGYKSTRKYPPVEFNGITYSSMREAMEITGISAYLIKQNKTEPTKNTSTCKSIIIDGVEYESYTEACQKLGVTRKFIKNYINNKTTKKHSFPVVIDGIEYPSVSKAMAATGMTHNKIKKNFLKGISQ